MSVLNEPYNVGRIIKKFARIVWLVTNIIEITAALTVIGFLASGDDLFLFLPIPLFGLPILLLFNTITYWFTYAFGQLVENSDIMAGRLEVSAEPTTLKEYQKKAEVTKKETAQTPNEKKFEVLQNLLAQGLITQDEFDQKVNELK